jgi:Pentapeptide repeats (8 copies)
LIHPGFIGGAYDGARNLRDEEHSLEEKEAQKGKTKPWTLREFGGKTIWDWMGLLIVPVVLSLITVVFAWQQDIRQNQIEKDRAKAERELAERRAQDEALQAYLDQMSDLLLEKDLRTSEDPSEVRTLARARTATVIQRLDSDRNRNVIRFLKETGLISETGLTNAEQSSFRLLAGTDLRGAHLEVSDLSGANLSDADLSGANLALTDLSDANLSYANLKNAYLHSAEGITNEELEQQAKTLEGAIMPNGQKYEDWLKDREGRKEDRENDGS